MTKYVFTYHNSDSTMPEEPSEVEALMAAWGAWFGEMGDAVVDGGNPFGPAATISPDGSTTDGAKYEVTGYSIVNAPNLDAAVKMGKNCPVLAGGGSVQVSEVIEM